MPLPDVNPSWHICPLAARIVRKLHWPTPHRSRKRDGPLCLRDAAARRRRRSPCGAHATPDVRRVRGAGAPDGTRPRPAPRHRGRPGALHAAVGAAGLRQDDAGQPHRRADEGALRDGVRGDGGRRGPAAGRRGGAGTALAERAAHHPLRGRDPPVQQGAAGRHPCRTSRRGPSPSSARRRRTPRSRSSRRCCRAPWCTPSGSSPTSTSAPSSTARCRTWSTGWAGTVSCSSTTRGGC